MTILASQVRQYSKYRKHVLRISEISAKVRFVIFANISRTHRKIILTRPSKCLQSFVIKIPSHSLRYDYSLKWQYFPKFIIYLSEIYEISFTSVSFILCLFIFYSTYRHHLKKLLKNKIFLLPLLTQLFLDEHFYMHLIYGRVCKYFSKWYILCQGIYILNIILW